MSKLSTTSKLGFFFGFLVILILAESCRKNNGDVIPYARINLALGLSTDLASLGVGEEATITYLQNGNLVIRFNDPRLPDVLLGIGQVLDGNGLIINRKDIYEYEVYDITCTFQAQTDYCPLERNPDFANVFDCPCCQSQFIYDGSDYIRSAGPAALPLKRYPAFIDAGSLIIRN